MSDSRRPGAGRSGRLHRGRAGFGKSRLLHELKRRLEGEDLTWLEGRCISYGPEISYLPLIDPVKDSFEIEESDNDAEIADKLEAGLADLGGESRTVPVPSSSCPWTRVTSPWPRTTLSYGRPGLRVLAGAHAVGRPIARW